MPLLGEVKLFAGRYAPESWMICDGRELQIQQHQALYSILGDAYGGDGRRVFNLPDLRNRFVLGAETIQGSAHSRTHGKVLAEQQILPPEILVKPSQHKVPAGVSLLYIICTEGGDYPPQPED